MGAPISKLATPTTTAAKAELVTPLQVATPLTPAALVKAVTKGKIHDTKICRDLDTISSEHDLATMQA